MFSVFHHLQEDKQRKQRHSLKLGKKRRESSERNYYIISPRVIINAIIIKAEYVKLLLSKQYYEKFMKTPESKYEKLYDEEPEIFYLLEEYEYIHPKDYKHEPPKVNIII